MNVTVDLDATTLVAVAHIEGEVDLADSTQFTDTVLGKMPDAATALVVDLSGMRYIDSAGVRSLFEIASALNMREQPLAFAVPADSQLRSVLRVTSVDEVADVCVTRDEALELLSSKTSAK